MKYRQYVVPLFLYALMSYPIFYYSYKFGSPATSGQRDFYDYYPLYSEMNILEPEAPYNMRVVSPSLVYLLNRSGLSYPIEINFQDPEIDQDVYLSTIIVHFVAAVLTAFLIFLALLYLSKDWLLSILGGGLYLVQYGTVFWGSGGITDGFSAALFALFTFFFLRKSYWSIPVLLLAIFQRELIILGAGVVSCIYWLNGFWNKKRVDRYYLITWLASLGSFIFFSILRNTLFYTPKNDHHFNVSNFFGRFDEVDFSLFVYLKGVVLSQNILAIYVLILLFKWIYGLKINWFRVSVIMSLFVFLHLVRAAINPVFFEVGRHMYILSPLFIVYMLLEAVPIFQRWYKKALQLPST